MSELQTTLELSIELQKFINVDLFHRGYYQIRIGFKVSPKFCSKVEVSLPKNSSCSLIFPACVINGTAVSKTFQILYKNEEVQLDDVVMFKVHLLVDGHRVREALLKADFQVVLELWFTDQNFRPEQAVGGAASPSLQCVSRRTLKLHFNPIRGLHHGLPVFFDYFHLSAVTLTFHMALIALCQPCFQPSRGRSAKSPFSASSPRNKKTVPLPSSLESVLLGLQSGRLPPGSRLRRAQLVHWNLCTLLLAAYSSLRRRLLEFSNYLPPWHTLTFEGPQPNLEHISKLAKECQKHVNKTATQSKEEFLAQEQSISEEEFVAAADSDIAQLCGSLIVAWHRLLEVAVGNDRVRLLLARHAHMLRVRRFAEAFFLVERSRDQLLQPCETSTEGYAGVSEALRRSRYLALLPPLEVECLESDGTPASLPILYEEHFQELNAPVTAAERRCSQGSLGLRCTRPPPSPSAHSLYSDPAGTKPKLRSRTAGFLRQFRRHQAPLFLGLHKKQLELKRPPAAAAIHMQHSQSTLSVLGMVLTRRRTALFTSESMPDLPSAMLPPPPPRPRFSSEWTASLPVPLSFDLRRRSLSPQPPKPLPTARSASETCVLAVPQTEASSNQKKSEEIWRDPYDEVFLNSTHVENILHKSSNIDPLFLNGIEDPSNPFDELCAPPSPPAQFRDEPHSGGAAAISEHFFPKPPAEFAEESVAQAGGDTTEAEPKSTTSTTTSTITITTTTAKEESAPSKENKKTDKKNEKCTALELFAEEDEDFFAETDDDEELPSARRASAIGSAMISFVKAKEEFRRELRQPWLLYSDFPSQSSGMPYFHCDSDIRTFNPDGLHLVICVHGLDGNSADLRLVRTFLELGLPTVNFEFLMSERNQGETFDDFELLTDRLVSEITYHIEVFSLFPTKISFIGHSLGNIIIRSALTRAELRPFLPRLHTLLSLSGPHLGTLYNSSGLVNMGMWFMQKWKKSGSLLQLSLKDASDPRHSFLYRLSQKPGMEYFHNILLFGSSQDRYVPLHSARIEMCKAALKDVSTLGTVYQEMVHNLLKPVLEKPDIRFLRYDVHHAFASNSANSFIGRAAHIALLDSELFIEKFISVCGLKYFH